MGFTFLLGVVVVDVIMDATSQAGRWTCLYVCIIISKYIKLLRALLINTHIQIPAYTMSEWKRGYYAAHRTAAFPYNAFIILVILLGFGSFVYNSFLSRTFFSFQEKTKKTRTLLPRPISDWRILLSACLGVLTFVLFVVKLVPQQDFIAQVVTENKSMLRNATLMEEALMVIKQGHLVIAAVLVALIGLQVSLLTYPGCLAGDGGDKCGSTEGETVSDGGKKRRQ